MSSLIQPPQGATGASAISAAPKPGSSHGAGAQSTQSVSASARSEAPVSLDTVPTSPPPEVLDQVHAAGRAYQRLQAQGLQVRYSHDPSSRRTTATLLDRHGAVLRTLSPSEAVKLSEGEAPPGG